MLKNFYLILIFFLICKFNALQADDKLNIINNLKTINSLKFDFIQETERGKEIGICFLSFPKKLRCIYDNNKNTILIVNNNNLIIYHERYKKIYYYPIKNSIFVKVLDKKELVNLIKISDLSYSKEYIYLTEINNEKNRAKIIFDKINFNLIGWEIYDQLNKKTSFLIKIKTINEQISSKQFLLPSLN